MYGTGNGADKILDACEVYGISVKAVFASSSFVRNRTFRGMPVLSYEKIREEYGDDVVILAAFGTNKPDVMGFFRHLDSRHDLIIPEVPLCGSGIFDETHLKELRPSLEKVYSLLSDDTSRELFKDAVMFRITGKLKYLLRTESMRDTFCSLKGFDRVKRALDGGAFKGDSTLDMLLSFNNVEKIIAVEPDPSTFKKLEAFSLTDAALGKVIPVECALSDKNGVCESVSSGSRGSGIEGRNKRAKVKEIRLSTVDGILNGEGVDYIKLDVEGSEAEAIAGASETLRNYRPIVSVSLYHRTDDIVTLPLLLKDVLGKSEFYLRRPECIPMWDLNMYVVPDVEED